MQIEKNGHADVLLVLDDSDARNLAKEMREKRGIKYDDVAIVTEKVRLFKQKKNTVLSMISQGDSTLLKDYDHLPILYMRLNSHALERLRNMSEVVSISENLYVFPFYTDSQALIGIPQAWSYSTGKGTAVAVIDSGIDYWTSGFSVCSTPGAYGCIAFDQCFATGGCGSDSSHGTNVSGIVFQVAPDTEILALDVFGWSGSAYYSDIISALNWVMANKAIYNTVAVNMSLGDTSKNTVPCSNNVLASAISTLKSSGIATVVASGNSGFTNAIAAPACAPDAISVGAVYAANYGYLRWSSCTDSSTQADQVTCFSNSSSFLSMLAPGAIITAGGYTMGGTSQAAPHVSGAVAVLKSLDQTLTVDKVASIFKATGEPVFDHRNSITKPRLDLDTAVTCLFTSFSIAINGGATYTKTAAVTLTLAANCDTAQMCISNSDTCTTWTAFAATKTWTLLTGNGTKTVSVWFKDAWGNTTPTPYTASIILDSTAPTNGTMTATHNADDQIALNWSGFADAVSGIASYKVVYATGAAPTSCLSGGTVPGYDGISTTYTHTGLNNGTVYYYRVCAIDNAGNMSTGATASAKAVPEVIPPTGSVLINNGDAWTKSAIVTLTLTADDASSPIQMCISNSGTCTTWTAFAATKSWTLLTGNGTKTVSVWFRDKWGNTTPTPYSASIILDTTAPTNGTMTATHNADDQITLSWSGFADAVSGIASYKVVYATGAAPTSCSSGTTIYSGTDTTYPHTGLISGKVYYYRVCAIDNAMNMSTGATASAKAVPEVTPPTGSVLINNGDAWTKSAIVTLTLTADDASSPIQMCISNSGTCTTWTAFAATKSWTLLTGNGTKTVSVWFRDKWGNKTPVGTPYTDTIGLDATVPVNGTVTATPGPGQIALNWSGFADAVSGIASYKVVYATGAAPTSCSSGTTIYSGTDTTYTHTGLINGTTYGYRVCAIDNAGNISTGVTKTAKPLPAETN